MKKFACLLVALTLLLCTFAPCALAEGKVWENCTVGLSKDAPGGVIEGGVATKPEHIQSYATSHSRRVSQETGNDRTDAESYLNITSAARYMLKMLSSILVVIWFRKKEK